MLQWPGSGIRYLFAAPVKKNLKVNLPNMTKIQAFERISSHTLARGFLGLSHIFSKLSIYSKHALPWDGMFGP